MGRAEILMLAAAMWMGLGIAHDHTRLTVMGALFLPFAVYYSHRDNRRGKGKTWPAAPPKVPPPPHLPKGD